MWEKISDFSFIPGNIKTKAVFRISDEFILDVWTEFSVAKYRSCKELCGELEIYARVNYKNIKSDRFYAGVDNGHISPNRPEDCCIKEPCPVVMFSTPGIEHHVSFVKTGNGKYFLSFWYNGSGPKYNILAQKNQVLVERAQEAFL